MRLTCLMLGNAAVSGDHRHTSCASEWMTRDSHVLADIRLASRAPCYLSVSLHIYAVYS